jgi:hypothetical protein
MKAHLVPHSPRTPVFASLTCLVLLAFLPLPTVAAAPRMHMHTHAARPSSPTAPTAATVPTAPVELSKVILPENSPTGPALWTIGGQGRGVPSSSTYNAALAWTGTDPAHHVNVLTSVDGQHFANKLTLVETAISSPAAAVILGSASAPRILVVAWTGTDARHSLNVLFDVFNVTGHRSKTTLIDTSIAGPALVTNEFLAGEDLELAWMGTDPNHSLNVLQLDEVCTGSPPPCGNVTGLSLGPKRTLPAGLHSSDGPGLTSSLIQDITTLLITWAQSNGSQLSLADVTPGVTNGAVFFSSQTTAVRPGLLALSGPQQFWWSWTGTDPLHSLNLMDTTNFTSWPGPVTTFAETATGGPALGSLRVANQLLLAWTGTDPAHLLNVAVIGV